MSRNSNPGAHEAMESVVSELAAELSRGSNMNTKDATAAVGLQVVGAPPVGLMGHGKADGTRFILYLSKETWLGEPGEALAEEVRKARAAGTPITMVHSMPDNPDGCEFGTLFATVRIAPRTQFSASMRSTIARASVRAVLADPGRPDSRRALLGARLRALPAALPPRVRLPRGALPRREAAHGQAHERHHGGVHHGSSEGTDETQTGRDQHHRGSRRD